LKFPTFFCKNKDFQKQGLSQKLGVRENKGEKGRKRENREKGNTSTKLK
jgi:hypothetical protein